MVIRIKSFKIVAAVALLVLSAAACTPISMKQNGIYGPPVATVTVASGDCSANAGVPCQQ
jgi:hypothetical protein